MSSRSALAGFLLTACAGAPTPTVAPAPASVSLPSATATTIREVAAPPPVAEPAPPLPPPTLIEPTGALCTWTADKVTDEQFTLLAPVGVDGASAFYAHVTSPEHARARLAEDGRSAFVDVSVDHVVLRGTTVGSGIPLHAQRAFAALGVFAPSTQERLFMIDRALSAPALAFGLRDVGTPLPVPDCAAVGLKEHAFRPRDAFKIPATKRRAMLIADPGTESQGGFAIRIRETASAAASVAFRISVCEKRNVEVVDESGAFARIVWPAESGSLVFGWIERTSLAPITAAQCGYGSGTGRGRPTRPAPTKKCDRAIDLVLVAGDARGSLVTVGQIAANVPFSAAPEGDDLFVVTLRSTLIRFQHLKPHVKASDLAGCISL